MNEMTRYRGTEKVGVLEWTCGSNLKNSRNIDGQTACGNERREMKGKWG